MSSTIYTNTNRIKFTSISEKYSIPAKYKSKQNELHGKLIQYVASHFQNTRKFKQKVVDALNILTYCVIENEAPPFNWSVEDPLATMPSIDMDLVKEALQAYYLDISAIDWDVSVIADPSEVSSPVAASIAVPVVENVTTPAPKPAAPVEASPVFIPAVAKSVSVQIPTSKEDLYIQPPKCPQFDYTKPWLSMQDGDDLLTIYTTLPEIPTKQNEISVTTDASKMVDSEFMSLYPNHIIRTRAPILYDESSGLKMDPDLGCILPIKGYTNKMIIDNMIKYPHFYKLKRILDDGEIISFYEDIELDGGELISISEVWDSLPESQFIPKQSEYIKEYVVRRYLLEEEAGIVHKYPMYGTLLPYLTLFMPPEEYIRRGYKDTLGIAKQCVASRVSFKQSRNPVLKRLNIRV